MSAHLARGVVVTLPLLFALVLLSSAAEDGVDNEVVTLAPPEENARLVVEKQDDLGESEAEAVGRRGGAFLSTTGSFTLSSGSNTAGNDEALRFELGASKNANAKETAGVKQLTDKYMAMAAKKKKQGEKPTKSKVVAPTFKCNTGPCSSKAIQQGWPTTCADSTCADCTPCGMCENQAPKKAGCYGTPFKATANVALPPDWSLESAFACSAQKGTKSGGKCIVSFAQMPRDAKYVNHGSQTITERNPVAKAGGSTTPRVDGKLKSKLYADDKTEYKFNDGKKKWFNHCDVSCPSCTAAFNAELKNPLKGCAESNPAKCGWVSSSCGKLYLYARELVKSDTSITVINPMHDKRTSDNYKEFFTGKKGNEKIKNWKRCTFVMVKWQFCRGPLSGGLPVCKSEKRSDVVSCEMGGSKPKKVDLTKSPLEPNFAASAAPYLAAF